MNNKRRYAIIMIFSIAINELFYYLAAYFHLPVWLDLPGTALAALVLEPTAGLIVGLVNNFFLAIFFYDSSSLVYYAISAAVALIVGLTMRNNGKIDPKRIIPTILMVIFTSAILSTILTEWRSGGVPTGWEIYYYNQALAIGIPEFLSCFWGIFVIKVYDTLANALIVASCYFLLPPNLKHAPGEQMQNLK